jgi:RNA polymerase sigma-70 factor, ECF subfamily
VAFLVIDLLFPRNTLLMTMREARLSTCANMNAPATDWPSDAERQLRMARLHYQLIWRSLRRMGLEPQAVDDATQRVFVLAAEKIERIAPGSERAFLLQTAVRIAMSIPRAYAQRREAMIGEQMDEITDPAPLPDAMAETLQHREHLDRLLESLPVDLRTVFVLFELEGLGSAEIASTLEIPVGTVASRLRRAREAFRESAERLRRQLEKGATR